MRIAQWAGDTFLQPYVWWVLGIPQGEEWDGDETGKTYEEIMTSLSKFDENCKYTDPRNSANPKHEKEDENTKTSDKEKILKAASKKKAAS